MIPSSSGASMPVAARASSSSARAARTSLERGDHRQHRLDRVLGGHAQDRAQLRGEDLGALRASRRMPRTPRNGLASGGIGSAGSGLSAPASSVRTTSGRPSSAHGDLAQGLDLLVLVGQLRAVEEEELGAQQADALGAELDRRGRLGGRAEVGEDLHARAVAHRARLVGALARGGAAGGERARGAPAASRSTSSPGSTWSVPASPSSSSARALVDGEQRVAEPDRGGQAERAGEDRGVRGGRAVGGGDPAHELGVEAGGLGGGQLAARARCRAPSGPARLLARDGGDDAAPDVEHVGGALAQQRLVERAVERGHLLGGVVPRALGGGAARDGLVGGLEQRLVVEQGEVGVEDGRLGLAGARRRPPRGRARSPRGRRRSPRPGARARARARRRRGRAAGRAGAPRWRAGPMATPAEAGDAGRARRPARGARDGGRRRPGDGRRASAARRRARCRRRSPRRPARAAPSSASAACGPDAVTTSVSPKRAPSATTLVRLVARTGAPPPCLGHADLGVVVAHDPDEERRRARVQADRVADLEARLGVGGRASGAGASASGAAAAAPASTPSCDAFMASAPRASAATSSSDAPPRAATAAATVPSTSGASLISTRPPPSSISIANSVLISALPRSMSTSTPSSDIARSIAARTRSASVPSAPGSSIPPAASSASSSPPISRASATTPSASASLWETTTRPTTARA